MMVTMHADLDNHLTHASIDISAAAASIVLCVQGHDVVALSGAGRFVVGLDISEAAIHKARQVRRRAPFSALLGRVNGNSMYVHHRAVLCFCIHQIVFGMHDMILRVPAGGGRRELARLRRCRFLHLGAAGQV